MSKKSRAGAAVGAAVALTLASAALETGPAAADIPSWYQDASAGLLVTWGLSTGVDVWPPGITPCDGDPSTQPFESAPEFEDAVADLGWDAASWVTAAEQLHAEYIVMASFHSLQGYVRPWPSDVPGSATTERDFLQELMDEAAESGIKVVVYITSDPSWATSGGCDWLDEDAYATWKGDPSINIGTPVGFSSYSYDVVDELMQNYPDIAGFWFDGWAPAWTSLGLTSHIRDTLPEAVIFANDSGTAAQFDQDVISVENIAKNQEPSFDYPGSAWVRQNDAEAVYAPAGWDYYAENTVQPRGTGQFEVQWFASIAGSGWPALMGLPTKLDGTFEPAINSILAHIDQFRDWADPAFGTTVAGGYDFGIQPGRWSDGSYGVVTSNGDGSVQYLHVLQTPIGGISRLSNGSWVTPTELDPHADTARTVTSDTAGDIWLNDTSNRIWRKSGATWQQMPGQAIDIVTGSDGSVWMVGTEPLGDQNGYLYRWNGSSWTFIGSGAVHMALDEQNNPWTVQKNGSMWRWDGERWHSVFTAGKDVANGPDGTIWRLGDTESGDAPLYRWTGVEWTAAYEGGGGVALSVDAQGDPWVTTASGDVYRVDAATGAWNLVTSDATKISTTRSGEVYKHESTTVVSVPDGGYTVTGATDLFTGEPLDFEQNNGNLTVRVANWDVQAQFGDQIIRLAVEASERQYPRSSLSASASSSSSGRPASSIVDADDRSYWSSSGVGSQSFTLETAEPQALSGLRVAQQETMPVTFGNSNAPPPARIRSAQIEVSSNGVDFTEVWSGELKSQRGAQVINFAPINGKFLRMTVLSNWAGTSQVQVQSADLLVSSESPAPQPQIAVTVETRCVASKAFVAVTVKNLESIPLDVGIETPYGSKSFTGIAAEKNAFHSFASRAVTVPAGTVSIDASGVLGGVQAHVTQDLEYESHSCAG